ncbi:hypothetical protein ACTMTJ_45005 [Phytohabitans sp. LJ34]|uniref:hypothetical protein n=1 Tax=Phytohabitans sp. LJ34 TaxID=3452217 RepID=UPI003F8AF47D
MAMPRSSPLALAVGQDGLARGRGELEAFQAWMSGRHSHSSLAFWSLVIEETFGAGTTRQPIVTDDDHQLAIAKLCLLLREFLGLSTNDRR